MQQDSPSLIQQQMYTRERRGIFRSAEGYDTIAVSKGIDASFIKKVLHPFCVYDAPAELASTGEKDSLRYPDATHLFHTEQGMIVYGRSVYLPADFTGLRSTFFTHNYVIPADRAGELVHDYKAWLRAAFATQYDIEQGTELPGLEELPVDAASSFHSDMSPREKLAALHIDERMFKQMLLAAMISASGKKKVYIALDVPIDHISHKARELLEILFECLPYAYRRLLGFATYTKDLQSRKGIHIMFVEKGSLRPNDRNTEKEFTFDLASGRVTNIDMELLNQPYLDFAWDNLVQPERAEQFYAFADLMVSDMDPVRQASVVSYHELCMYYLIEEGQIGLYDLNKSAILRGMLEYLHPPGAITVKHRLNELLAAMLEREFLLVKQGNELEVAVAECFKDYFRLSGGKHEGQIVALFIHAISQCKAAKAAERANSLYGVIRKSPALSKQFFDTVMDRGLAAALFDPYMNEQFSAVDRAGDVIDLVCEWGSQHPQVLKNSIFTEIAQSALRDKLLPESDPVTVVNAILEQLWRLPRARREDAGLADSELVEKLAYTANLFLLTELKLESVSKDQLLKIGFLEQPEEVKAWAKRFGAEVRSQAAIMLASYDWFCRRDPDISIFAELSVGELERVQQLGRQWLSREVNPANFSRIVLAFYRDNDGLIEYGALLQYLHKYAADVEIVYQFMKWSESHPSFVRKKANQAYAAALITYFKKLDREAFKKRAYRKPYFEQAGPALKPIYERARLELSSPLVRVLTRKKGMFMSLLVVIVLIGGTVIGLQAAGVLGADKEAAPGGEQSELNKPGETAPPPNVDKPTVYAEQIESTVDGVTKTATQLVFTFTDGQACSKFNPSDLTLVHPEHKEVPFTGLQYQATCEVQLDGTEGTAGTTEAEGTTPSGLNDNTDKNADKNNDSEGNSDKGTAVDVNPAGDGASGKQQGSKPEGDASIVNQVIVQLPEVSEALPANTIIRIGTEEYRLMNKPTVEPKPDESESKATGTGA